MAYSQAGNDITGQEDSEPQQERHPTKFTLVIGQDSERIKELLLPTNPFTQMTLYRPGMLSAHLDSIGLEALFEEPEHEVRLEILGLMHDLTYTELSRILHDPDERPAFISRALREIAGRAMVDCNSGEYLRYELPSSWFEHVFAVAIDAQLARQELVISSMRRAFPRVIHGWYTYDSQTGYIEAVSPVY